MTPMVVLLFLGPMLAEKFQELRVILISRFLSAMFALIVGLTTNALVGGSAYILFRSTISLAQTMWFGVAVSVATRRSRMATSAWLEITFQIGLGIAAIVGGRLVAGDSYFALGLVSSISMFISFILTYVFFGTHRKNKSASNLIP